MKQDNILSSSSNILAHFTHNNIQYPDITDNDIEQLLLPIKLAMNDSQRKNMQCNFKGGNNSLRSEMNSISKRTVTIPGSTIRSRGRSSNDKLDLSRKGRSNFVLKQNENGDFVLGRKEGKSSMSIGKMKLRNQMLNVILNEAKEDKNKPPKFVLEKKPEVQKFKMETELIDDINENNKYVSKISFQY